MSLTGPSEVWRQRVSRCSDPLSPGSTILGKVLVINIIIMLMSRNAHN